ncbi:hypothetical protein [Oenococcus sp.]|uniref:hypothetical protein n=1 Tax=Oenococcus sp. TaxID=1979414 RepID=UPI0039E80029
MRQSATAYVRKSSFKKSTIVLASEPTSALDFSNTQIVMRGLCCLANMDKIVIVATHNLLRGRTNPIR